jgi:hypothetical protein
MKDLNAYINEGARKFEDADEYLEHIVNSAKADPDIWDDTGDWEARDAFDYWESAFGEFDDILDFIDEYASGKSVAGWNSEESFEDAEKKIPQKLKSIMKKSKPKMPYKKRNNKMEVWEVQDGQYNVAVMKFMNYMNDNGTDYVQYWYMIAIDE